MKAELINWKAIFIFLLIITFALFFFFPFYFMVSSSFKHPLDSSVYPPIIFNFEPTLKNYTTIFKKYPMATYFINSFIVAIFATLVSMVLAIPASYGMERLISKNRERVAYMFLTMQLIANVPFERAPRFVPPRIWVRGIGFCSGLLRLSDTFL